MNREDWGKEEMTQMEIKEQLEKPFSLHMHSSVDNNHNNSKRLSEEGRQQTSFVTPSPLLYSYSSLSYMDK